MSAPSLGNTRNQRATVLMLHTYAKYLDTYTAYSQADVIHIHTYTTLIDKHTMHILYTFTNLCRTHTHLQTYVAHIHINTTHFITILNRDSKPIHLHHVSRAAIVCMFHNTSSYGTDLLAVYASCSCSTYIYNFNYAIPTYKAFIE